MSVKCLIYCTKAKPYLTRGNSGSTYPSCVMSNGIKEWHLNGKIVASFDCEKVEVFTTDYRGDREQNKRIAEGSLVPIGDLADYEIGKHFLYAIHISNLEIFDEPKELSEYLHPFVHCNNYCNNNCIKSFCKDVCSHNSDPERLDVWCDRDDKWNTPLTKSPQNMMYVCDSKKNHYVLISIKPEWVAKILNGEKTIEVRKKVVNALKELI